MNDFRFLKRRAITSYGIILFTISKEGEILYQLCQRRDTISYAEFLKDNLQPEVIKMHISLMSKDERQRCVEYYIKNDPESLWRDLWINHRTKFFKSDMKRCCDSFNKKMQVYINEFLKDEGKEENPWGFSKGRKHSYESEVECALREFEEETSIQSKDIQVIDYDPYEEVYTGTDGKLYKTVYYLAYIPYIPDVKNKISNGIRKTYISEEISKMQWSNYGECVKKLDYAKQCILKKINNRLLFKKKKPPRRRFTI